MEEMNIEQKMHDLLIEANGLVRNACKQMLFEDITHKAGECGWQREDGKPILYYHGKIVSGNLNMLDEIPVQLVFDRNNGEAVNEAYDLLLSFIDKMEDI